MEEILQSSKKRQLLLVLILSVVGAISFLLVLFYVSHFITTKDPGAGISSISSLVPVLNRYEVRSLNNSYEITISDRDRLNDFVEDLRVFSVDGAVAKGIDGDLAIETIKKVRFVLLAIEDPEAVYNWPQVLGEDNKLTVSRAYDNDILEIRTYMGTKNLSPQEISKRFTIASIMGLHFSSVMYSNSTMEEIQKDYYEALDHVMGESWEEILFTISKK